MKVQDASLLLSLCAVGLKMTLLDPGLSIDLQYLGVHLPLPPPGAGTVTSPQGEYYGD